MDGAIETLKKEFAGLRTGRASPALLEPIRVEAYGTIPPLNQVANISVAGPGLLSVQVWDKSITKAVESAIRDAGLGLNPMTEGQVIRVPLPPLTAGAPQRPGQDRRQVRREHARVAVRDVRRDGMEQIKALEKDKKAEASQDERQALERRGAEADRRSTSSRSTAPWRTRKRTSGRSDAGPDRPQAWIRCRWRSRAPPLAPAAGRRRRPCRAHVAIIMDGNGRWAEARGLPRALGHKAGAEAARRTIEAAAEAGIGWLTLFAFSTENWRRPAGRGAGPDRAAAPLPPHRGGDAWRREGVRLRVIGDRDRFGPDIVARHRARRGGDRRRHAAEPERGAVLWRPGRDRRRRAGRSRRPRRRRHARPGDAGRGGPSPAASPPPACPTRT